MHCSFKLPVLNCFDIACFQKRAGNFNRLKLFHISSRMSSLIVDSKCCPCVSQCRSIPGVVLQKTCRVGPFLTHKQENFLLDVDSMGIKLSSNIAHNPCEYVVSRCAVFVALLIALLKVCDYNRNSVRLPQQRCNGACVRVSITQIAVYAMDIDLYTSCQIHYTIIIALVNGSLSCCSTKSFRHLSLILTDPSLYGTANRIALASNLIIGIFRAVRKPPKSG